MKNTRLLFFAMMLIAACSETPPAEKQAASLETSLTENTTAVQITSSVRPTASADAYYPNIQSYILEMTNNFESIEEGRKKQLKKLALYIKSKVNAGEEAKLVYICTHNSRRSHMSQLWGMVAADYYGLDRVSTYSGGTESTAFNPRSVAALKRAGFQITPITEGENPKYEVNFADNKKSVEAFSKKYTHKSNPQNNFVAVMTCSQADKNCPTVDGASMRIAIPYVDPKVSDGTPEEAATYDERCKQIATEEFYLFSQVKA